MAIKKKHAKKIQVLIADLKSARKNTIETNKPFLNKDFAKKIFGMINNCHVAIFARFTKDPDGNIQHAIRSFISV